MADLFQVKMDGELMPQEYTLDQLRQTGAFDQPQGIEVALHGDSHFFPLAELISPDDPGKPDDPRGGRYKIDRYGQVIDTWAGKDQPEPPPPPAGKTSKMSNGEKWVWTIVTCAAAIAIGICTGVGSVVCAVAGALIVNEIWKK